MPLPDAFDPAVTDSLIARIGQLSPASRPLWGKMNCAQMLAHCTTIYKQTLGELGGGPWLVRELARLFFKKSVVGEEPFSQNLPTPKSFQVRESRNFEREREALVGYIRRVHGEGAAAFEGRTHITWGPLTAREWSNLFYKHLDHHLRQFSA